jgi:hypothetical protein
MRRIARESKGPGNIYFTGGASMLLWGIRGQTIDVDLKLDPEPPGVFEAIAVLKDELEVNVELASPDDFLPAPPDWRERSPHIQTLRTIGFYHYDPRMQALAKIERGLDQDLDDCVQLLKRGLIRTQDLWETFSHIKPLMIRYPAVDAEEFEKKVRQFLGDYEKREDG